MLRAFDRATERGTIRAGWGAIGAALRPHRHVLMGVHHDAGEHVRAFARLFGPAGTADGRLLAIELLDADGRWIGMDESDQRGDDEALADFRAGGSAEALGLLRRRLAEGAYTAWKYDYLDDVVELAVLARGAGQTLMGCDVPPALSRMLAPREEVLRLRARELHCALALRDAQRSAPAAPVALLFGDAHAQPEGIARFLPLAPVTLHVVGGRRSDAGIEPALGEHLALLDPVLVPLSARRFALLLPDARLGARGDRSRVQVPAQPVTRVHARSSSPAELWVGGEHLALGEELTSVPISPGRHAFVVRQDGLRIAGALPLDRGGSAEISADPADRRVDRVLSSAAEAPPGSL